MGKMSTFSKLWRAAVLAGGAGIAGLAAANAIIRRNVGETDNGKLGGDAHIFEWQDGDIYFRQAGPTAAPNKLLLLHGISAGASSFTWRKNFDELADDFGVYAPDFIGFGYSDKPSNISYDAELFVEFIRDFIREAIGAPVHVVACSLAAAYAIRVAAQYPELVESLVAISPTGTGELTVRPGVAGAAYYGLMNSPVLGASFYNVVTSERSIRDYARQQYFFDRRRVTERFVAHHYASSHQAGAQYAIAAFLSGYMNTDVREDFARLTQPVTLLWGQQDESNPLDQAAELVRLNPRARLEIIDRCRMSPHEEHPDRFNELLTRLLIKPVDNVIEMPLDRAG
jgi:pimeloyl-ACP methyl ester carboxylesterase